MGKEFIRTRASRAKIKDIDKDKRVKSKETKTVAEESAPPPLVKNIVEYLNLKSGKTFKYTSKATAQKINARLNEKYTEDDFKSVIDFKCEDWLHDSKMNQYLQPATLFGTKFEGYLEASKAAGMSCGLKTWFEEQLPEDERVPVE